MMPRFGAYTTRNKELTISWDINGDQSKCYQVYKEGHMKKKKNDRGGEKEAVRKDLLCRGKGDEP